jgi:ornithine cyclodeaminase/alanine dehydrogenase-like protein (mu-crystallin family)
MVNPILHLNASEVLSALDGIDPVDLLADELTGENTSDRTQSSEADVRLTPWRPRATPGVRTQESVLFEDRRTGARCVLPVSSLRACRAAALSGLAARTLLGSGMVTSAILGSGYVLQAHLTVILRHLGRVGSIAICAGEERQGSLIEPRLLDQIDLAGIRLVVAPTVAAAVSAADLAVVVRSTAARLEIGVLAKGTVVVNATGQDLPGDLVGSVDQIYVDDASLIEKKLDRYTVRTHLSGQRRIDADLGQVLSGTHPGRTYLDHILLVELLGADVLSPSLAGVLHRTAVDRRLGSQLFE